MKVSGKLFGLIFSVAVGFVMSLAMSFFMLVFNVGLIDGFFLMWMRSFLIGFSISIPIAIVAIPQIRIGLTKVFKVGK
ncbi:MAG TPA: hypothetical protein DCE41_08255 [Cytophagales bacterium]|nr:hypothetical protein [Cytophagales bacterium]HAA17727.1 hypothetical protein [Cytophagales bacterium]HAP58038.1 hypothetical protein [Cytophagales bacterium]